MGTLPDPTKRGGLPQELARYAGHGLTLAASTGLFLFIGLKVDGWLGTLPLFTVLGALVGASAGFYSMYHHLVVEPRERAAADERERGADAAGSGEGGEPDRRGT
ncbi:MAG TPA: AtpZ/AtpI family protein [Longimicrobiales bacterium]|nr:AtpZ/AtpI family protein [Longimicrobiales bacterium]